MSITAYTGVMGSGKSYEVVKEVIIPAIAAGRRVVTNISGLSQEKILQYIQEKSKNQNIDTAGEIISFENDVLLSNNFFPSSSKDGFVKGGDLVVIDEAWRSWGSGQKIRQDHLEFWRMHRHFTHPVSGISCDLVVISQDIGDLHRSLKLVIELSFRTKKLKSLGLSTKYTVEMWEGTKQSRKGIKSSTRTYDKDVFPLYKSYSSSTSSTVVEMSVDKRQNIFSSLSTKIGMPIAVIILILSIWYMIKFFSPSSYAGAEVSAKAPAVVPVQAPATTAAIPAPVPVGDLGLTREPRRVPRVSAEWRLAGFVAVGARRVVLLVNNSGRVRFEAPGAFTFEDGRPVAGVIDNQRVTAWSGSLSSPSSEAPSASPLLLSNEAQQ